MKKNPQQLTGSLSGTNTYVASVVRWAPMVLIVAACVAAYANSFTGQFVLDDGNSIYQNPSVKSFWGAFSPPDTVNIFRRQFVNVTLAINYAISGFNVWSYHLVNLIIHTISGLALFGILKSILQDDETEAYKNSGVWIAAFAASLWAVHPLQTQSVTYIIQRCESLVGMCVLLTVFLSIRSMKSSTPWPWRAGALVTLLASVFVKESFFIAPLLILFYDRMYGSGSVVRGLKKNKYLYLGFLVCLLISLFNLSGYIVSEKTEQVFSPLAYALSQPEVVFQYLRLTVWPDNLILQYDWPVSEIGRAIPFLLGVLVLIAGSVWLAVKRNRYGFFLCWFWITLAPSSSLFPVNDLIFEQRMYLPLAGLAAVLVMGGYDLLLLFKEKTGRNLILVGVIMWVVVLSASIVRTATRNTDYTKGELYMWQDTVAKQPTNQKALSLIGKGLAQQQKYEESLVYYNKVLAINPDSFVAHNDMAVVYNAMGDRDMAETHLRAMIRIKPDVPMPYLFLSKIMMEQREVDEAVRLLEKAVEVNPKLLNVRGQLAQIYYRAGQLNKALRHVEAYLAESPDNKQARQLLQAIRARL